jgi:hypothetical protein
MVAVEANLELGPVTPTDGRDRVAITVGGKSNERRQWSAPDAEFKADGVYSMIA